MTIKVNNEGPRAKVYIYGTIGDHWREEKANRSKDFVKVLDELSPKPVDIHIDSSGGDVFEGFAIASAISRYAGETHAYVDALAASAASYIAVMADKVTMNDFSAFMIHNASGIVMGNRDDMRETADLLEKLDNNIASAIASRTGMGLDAVKDAMRAETWYFGDDAKTAGLCDEVIKTERRAKAHLDREFADLYKNVPEGIEVTDEAPSGEQGPQDISASASFISAGAFPRPASAQDAAEGGPSHALPIIGDNEATDAIRAILLGNRIYRKEQ